MSNWPLGIVSSAGGGQTEGFQLWVWGTNNEGGHGDGTSGTQTNSQKSAPLQMGEEENWARLAQTGGRTSYAIDTDGKLYSWGGAAYGQNGRGNVVNASVPIQVGDLETWGSIAGDVSGYTTHAVTTDGKLFGWGQNSDYGNLGNGSHNAPPRASSPIQIGALTNWSTEIGHMAKGDGSTCAIKQDGTMWSWGGSNHFGMCGDGTVINRSSPVQIGSDTNWTYVVPHFFGFTALKSTGALYSWGNNAFGQAGNGTIGAASVSGSVNSVPTQIGTDTDWENLGGENRVVGAVKTNGKLYMWGEGTDGRTGSGAKLHLSLPTQIGALTTWSEILVRQNVTIAKKTDGTIWAWGGTYSRSVGDGTIIARSSPVQIATDDGWGQIAGYNNNLFMLKSL